MSDSNSCVAGSYVDTMSTTSYEDSVFALEIPAQIINTNPSCGCGVDNSLELTWKLYLSYQDSASLFTHVDNDLRNKYTAFATQTRKCWEAMHKAYKQQGKEVQATTSNPLAIKSSFKTLPAKAKARKVKKRKHYRLPRRRVSLNDNIWSKLFPFRG